MMRRLRFCCFVLALLLMPALTATARAADRLCDPANEDCRAILINLIRNETVGIDVAFWFMEDARYSNELIKKWQAGVPVRVIVDSRANASYPHNADRLNELKLAGIPMRERFSGGILHWKMMLFVGQNTVEFSGANYSADAWRPVDLTQPYTNYVDEAIFFTDKDSIVNSFKTKYDDLWLNTSAYRNYANITTPLARNYATFTKDPELNFPPAENYSTRSTNAYNAEKQKIDVIMYRITDQRHTNAIINAVNRGIPVRLITEPAQYREPSRLWHSWNVDRLYMAGVQIKHRAHPGLNHQKSVLLYGQGMTIFGSSNWTSPSANSQEEHNLFTKDPVFFDWFVQQFERKWNNTTGNIENEDFVPLPPDTPKTPTPANLATGIGTTVVLKWYGGPWAHLYDIYFGTTPEPPLVQSNAALGPSENAADFQTFAIPTTLTPGTTYYWKIVAKTMANMPKSSPVWSFTTGGTAPPPPPTGGGGEGDIILYAAEAPVKVGAWTVVTDNTAAGGSRIYNTNAGLAKVTTASPTPPSYIELTFNAEANRGYRLWMRGRADNNAFGNDSVHIQFDGSVTSTGTPTWRIGTTSSTEYNLEDCSGCGLAGWGWQDNGWGVGVMGPLVYFQTTGPQTIRIQTREDGLSIDQIVLSPEHFLSTAPGALKNDTTILSKIGGGPGGGEDPPQDPPPPTGTDPNEIVLWAGEATTSAGGFVSEADVTAAGGVKMRQADQGAPKVGAPSGTPGTYFEMTFNAEAGKPYRLWLRLRADNNHWANDSVWVQFDGSVDVNGNAIFRIGSTSGTDVNLEDCSGCGVAGWGWQDNGYGANVLGPLVYFATTGTQRIRIQTREDGVAIDQIVLSAARYLTIAPGSLKNDVTILAK
jgi:phosphatidylserine/phosphatidylglycerophosphate/cardiolipin synthase-like enzyme